MLSLGLSSETGLFPTLKFTDLFHPFQNNFFKNPLTSIDLFYLWWEPAPHARAIVSRLQGYLAHKKTPPP